MHVGDLLELGLVVATHAPVFIESRCALPQGAIEQYWSASKCRLDRWYRAFRAANDPASPSPAPVADLVTEVLASELLTRVFLAACEGHDGARGEEELQPVAHSVWLSHLEARRSALERMVHGPGIDLGAAVECNRFRRRVERWTDLLLGRLSGYCQPTRLAFDVERVADFSADFRPSPGGNELAWNLALASTRMSLRTLTQTTVNVDLNRQIASAVLACLGDDVYDAFGLCRSLWLERLSRTASDTQGMIDQLLRLDAGLPVTEALQLRAAHARRRDS
jgi:hypothetical protein